MISSKPLLIWGKPFPIDLFPRIIDYLEISDLPRVALVCHSFQEVSVQLNLFERKIKPITTAVLCQINQPIEGLPSFTINEKLPDFLSFLQKFLFPNSTDPDENYTTLFMQWGSTNLAIEIINQCNSVIGSSLQWICFSMLYQKPATSIIAISNYMSFILKLWPIMHKRIEAEINPPRNAILEYEILSACKEIFFLNSTITPQGAFNNHFVQKNHLIIYASEEDKKFFQSSPRFEKMKNLAWEFVKSFATHENLEIRATVAFCAGLLLLSKTPWNGETLTIMAQLASLKKEKVKVLWPIAEAIFLYFTYPLERINKRDEDKLQLTYIFNQIADRKAKTIAFRVQKIRPFIEEPPAKKRRIE